MGVKENSIYKKNLTEIRQKLLKNLKETLKKEKKNYCTNGDQDTLNQVGPVFLHDSA